MGPRIVVILILFATALFSSCKDDGKQPPDSAPMIEAGACVGTVAFLAACTADDECTSCLCKSFGHSKVCTNACDGPEDCAAPSGGCSNGFCRP